MDGARKLDGTGAIGPTAVTIEATGVAGTGTGLAATTGFEMTGRAPKLAIMPAGARRRRLWAVSCPV